MLRARVMPRLVVASLVLTLLAALPLAVGAESGSPTPADICKKIANYNVVSAAEGKLRPGPEYADGFWLRDSFWTSGYLGPEIGRAALDLFGSKLTESGQAPTKVEADGVTVQIQDDESTILYLIWAYRDGGQPRERLAKAWYWVTSHVDRGAYYTPPGPFHSWHDILVSKTWDVLSYNQGLYATAALAMLELGVAYPDQAQAAVDAYNGLYRPQIGFLPVSMRMDYHDTSVVVGEVLARTLLKKKMLADEIVVKTVRALDLGDYPPLAGTGFKVLSAANSDYLDESAFYPYSLQGRYQNGGSWLLYDTIAWTALGLAGDEMGFTVARLRVQLESFWGTFFEYVSTGPAGKIDMLPQHPDYAWNAYVCTLVK